MCNLVLLEEGQKRNMCEVPRIAPTGGKPSAHPVPWIAESNLACRPTTWPSSRGLSLGAADTEPAQFTLLQVAAPEQAQSKPQEASCTGLM